MPRNAARNASRGATLFAAFRGRCPVGIIPQNNAKAASHQLWHFAKRLSVSLCLCGEKNRTLLLIKAEEYATGCADAQRLKRLVQHLYEKAKCRLCADGGHGKEDVLFHLARDFGIGAHKYA